MVEFVAKVLGINKLMDYTASGVGAIAGPMLANWRASKEGKARITSAHADAEVRRIGAESEAATSLIIAKARSEATEYLLPAEVDVQGIVEISGADIKQRIEFQERKRLANIRAVVEGAADELGDREVPDHEPDPDWTARFFDNAQDVSSEDMQKIWSRLLAGEVESPGRTSLRTLDTIRNMTKKDAVLFKGLCDFVLNHDFVFYDDSLTSFSALDYGNLLHLEDCGLLNTGPNLIKVLTWGDDNEILLRYQREFIVITREASSKERLEVPDKLLTTAGRELYPFVQSTWQMGYLQALAGFLKLRNCQLHRLEGASVLTDGGVSYSNRIPIEPQSVQPGKATP